MLCVLVGQWHSFSTDLFEVTVLVLNARNYFLFSQFLGGAGIADMSSDDPDCH